MRTVQTWTCELGYGADTMFHKTYFLLSYALHTRPRKNWIQQENKDSEFLSSGVGVGLHIKVYDSDSRNQASQLGWACH